MRYNAIIGLLALALLRPAPLQAAGHPPLVLAHYMVCCPRVGHSAASVANFASEIADARRLKVDGFALNVGAWLKEPYYQEATRQIFAAAEAFPDFKLLFSFDRLAPGEADLALRAYHDHPNYLRVDGQPIVSSFGGDHEWGTALKARARVWGGQIVLVPYYSAFSYPGWDVPARLDPRGRETYIVEKHLENDPELDGYFFFGAAGRPEQIAAVVKKLTKVVKEKGKIAMMPVSPFYRGIGARNSRVFEYSGFTGMETEWKAAIDAGADWIELVTWNDWGEATYLSPFGSSTEQYLRNGPWGLLPAHEKYLEASGYYIDWYKTGTAPQILHDKLYYFYRLHPKDAQVATDPGLGTIGRPQNWESLKDEIFFTSFLKVPMQLVVDVGGKQQPISLPAGVYDASVPMADGDISVTASRGGAVVARKTLELPIGPDGLRGNDNYFAGGLDLEPAGAR